MQISGSDPGWAAQERREMLEDGEAIAQLGWCGSRKGSAYSVRW